jgi:hypothetical protein
VATRNGARARGPPLSPGDALEAREIQNLGRITREISRDESREQRLERSNRATAGPQQQRPPAEEEEAEEDKLNQPRQRETRLPATTPATTPAAADAQPSSLSTLAAGQGRAEAARSEAGAAGAAAAADVGKIRLLGWTVEGNKEVPLYAGPSTALSAPASALPVKPTNPATHTPAAAAAADAAAAAAGLLPLLGWTTEGARRIPVYALDASAGGSGSAAAGAAPLMIAPMPPPPPPPPPYVKSPVHPALPFPAPSLPRPQVASSPLTYCFISIARHRLAY